MSAPVAAQELDRAPSTTVEAGAPLEHDDREMVAPAAVYEMGKMPPTAA
jgi:hypothetical protein